MIEAAVLCLHVCETGVIVGVDVSQVDLGRRNDMKAVGAVLLGNAKP